MDFIVVRVALSDRVGRRCDEGVVIGDVCRYMSIQNFSLSEAGKALTGSKTTDFLGRTFRDKSWCYGRDGANAQTGDDTTTVDVTQSS